MSIKDKINHAQPSSWLTEGIPKWRVKLIIWWAKMQARIMLCWQKARAGKMNEDAVKREAVLNTLDTMDKALDEDRTVEHYKELLAECYKALPPVTTTAKESLVVEDAVSRQAVLDVITANCIWENEYNLTSNRIKNAVEKLPPVTPKPTECEDTVRRIAVIDLMRTNWADYDGDTAMQLSIDGVREMPAATPESPKGDSEQENYERGYKEGYDKGYHDGSHNSKLNAPRSVIYISDGFADGAPVYDVAECPNCGYEYELDDKDWREKWCPHCGQLLFWGEE